MSPTIDGAIYPNLKGRTALMTGDGSGIGLCPPLIISAEEIDEMLDLFARTLKTVEERVSIPA